ncbi:soluble hydrogenase 42 kDa subunit [bacterium BMS3Abin01]|nr:soluble hydrogenase 42 kDa subunit [bacterium BMS3Abin01]HDZ59404.1 alanine--glyoxylate aminotransferase family protein [Actinomycetota bacterium]
MKKRFLMTPGPTQIPPEVLLASAQPIIHHRTAEYSELFARTIEGLKYVFQTDNDIFFLASSGTGAMESAVVNLCSPGDEVLICSSGKFGERWQQLAETYGLLARVLDYPYGSPVDPEDIASSLTAHDGIKVVFVTHSETSTGVVNDIETIGDIVDKTDAVLVADSISGMGSAELRTDSWHVDVAVAGSQKALMLPPGLAFVSVSDKAWELVKQSTLPRYYFDWRKARAVIRQDKPTTPFTPAVSLTVALDSSLAMIREEGLDNLFRRHRAMGRATREAVKALGLELFSPDEERCSSVTAVKVPDGIDDAELRRLMLDRFGVQLAGGQGTMKGEIIRVGHCGFYNYSDIIVTITALELALKTLGYPIEIGSGVSRAEAIFAEEAS